jgi:hypothetical protein
MAAVVAIGGWGGVALHEAFERGDFSAAAALRALARPLAGLALVLLVYALRVSHLVEEFSPSELRLSREERMREAATLSQPRHVVFAGLGLASMSGLVVILESRAWGLGALGMAMGLGLAGWGLRLVRMARDAARSPASSSAPGALRRTRPSGTP